MALKSAYAFDCLESAVMSLDDRFTPDDLHTNYMLNYQTAS